MAHIKRILLVAGLFLSLTISVYADNINSESIDLDLDGKKEYAQVIFKNNINPSSIKIWSEDPIKLLSEIKLEEIDSSYLGIDVIDINPNDKNREIILSRLVSKRNSIVCRLDIFSFENNKITKMAHFYSNPSPSHDGYNFRYSLDRKNSIFAVLSMDSSPFFYNYYEKYKYEDKKFQKITADEVNASFFGEHNLNFFAPKDIVSYTNKHMKETHSTIKCGDNVTILCINKKGKYVKIKDNNEKIIYIPTSPEIYQ